MTKYVIHHPLIDLEIALIELHKLVIHEEILSCLLHPLVNNIRSRQVLMHPIIVDRQHFIVLDGMHRIAAIQKLGCRFIPVCLIDYQNPHVTIGSWFRIIHGSLSKQDVRVLLSQQYHLREQNLNQAQSLVEKRKALAALILASKCYTLHRIHADAQGESIHNIYSEIQNIENSLQRNQFSITYETDTDAFSRLNATDDTLIMQTPTVRKSEVVAAALRNLLFNHKTTRHMIPLRPMFLNIPLEWLYSEVSSKDINHKLVRYLSTKSYRRYPPGQVFDRRYDEELYVYS